MRYCISGVLGVFVSRAGVNGTKSRAVEGWLGVGGKLESHDRGVLGLFYSDKTFLCSFPHYKMGVGLWKR